MLTSPIGALRPDLRSPAQMLSAMGYARRNALVNGEFSTAQVTLAAIADDTYGHDGWYALTQTGTITPSTLTGVENGLPYMARLTQSQAVAQRMGYAQIIEGANCKHLRGQTVTFCFGRVRISASQPVRYAVLEWTGTEDAVTSDVVNDWTSADYTDGAAKFFVDASITPSGNTSHTPAAATLTDGPSLTVTLGSTFNNLVVLAWTEGTAAQNFTLDLGRAQLEIGSTATTFDRRPINEVLTQCERHTQVWSGPDAHMATGGAISTTRALGVLPLRTPMRAAPTVTISAAGDFSFRTVASAALTVLVLDNATVHNLRFDAQTGAATYVAGEAGILVATTANARLILRANL
jgi:hypothetical protein